MEKGVTGMGVGFALSVIVGALLGVLIAYLRFRTIERGGREDRD